MRISDASKNLGIDHGTVLDTKPATATTPREGTWAPVASERVAEAPPGTGATLTTGKLHHPSTITALPAAPLELEGRVYDADAPVPLASIRTMFQEAAKDMARAALGRDYVFTTPEATHREIGQIKGTFSPRALAEACELASTKAFIRFYYREELDRPVTWSGGQIFGDLMNAGIFLLRAATRRDELTVEPGFYADLFEPQSVPARKFFSVEEHDGGAVFTPRVGSERAAALLPELFEQAFGQR